MLGIDILIPVKPCQYYRRFLPVCIDSIVANVQDPIHSIILVGDPHFVTHIRSDIEIKTVSEPIFFSLLEQTTLVNWQSCYALHAGWVKQQIIKLYSYIVSECDYILIVDADLCFLRPLSFLENGKQIIYVDKEFYPPYFATIKQLFGLDKVMEESFISDHMLFQVEILKELVNATNTTINKPFLLALNEIMASTELSPPPLSEYETYGTYLMSRYPDRVSKFVLNPNRGLPHVYLPPESAWSYQIIKEKIEYDHYFIPMFTDSEEWNWPPFRVGSI